MKLGGVQLETVKNRYFPVFVYETFISVKLEGTRSQNLR